MKNTAKIADLGTSETTERDEIAQFPDAVSVIKQLRPINRLPAEAIEKLAAKTEKLSTEKGTSLFNTIKDREFVYFLLDGEINLIKESAPAELMSSDDDGARSALDRRTKNVSDIVCTKPCILAKLSWRELEQNLLEFAPNELDSNTLEVKEILSSTCSDWMVRLLQSDLLAALPPANIQEVMSAVEPLQVKKDETIIRQGDDPDHFYVIEKGQYGVLRHIESSGREVQLAKLKTGDFFGEEALITGNKRGTTVKALANGMVLKVHGNTFTQSIVEPTVVKIGGTAAQERLGDGSILIDVRETELYEAGSIAGSINLVLKLLRINSNQLDKEANYITVADEPNAAALAAFLLRVRGFNACALSVPIEDFAAQQEITLVKTNVDGADAPAPLPASPENEIIDDTQNPPAEIAQLAKEHEDKDDVPVPKEDYAHTVIGIGLADLIDELHDDDGPEKTKTDTVTPIRRDGDEEEPHLGEIHSQIPEADFDGKLGETVENPLDKSDGKVIELDIDAAAQETDKDVDLIVDERVAEIRLELENEMRQELEKQKQAAMKVLKAQQQKLNRQFQAKQQQLMQNSKKLIALANKISQQKAEVEAARKSLRDALDQSEG